MPPTPSREDRDGPPAGHARVGAVVVQYGASELSPSLVRELSSPEIAVVVVRNPREPGDAEAPVPVPGAQLVACPTNVGYGHAANLGREHSHLASTEIQLVLTHEVELSAGCIEALARALDAHPDLGVVGPVLEEPDGRLSVGGTRSRIGRVRQRVVPFLPFEGVPEQDGLIDAAWLDGAVLAMRRDVAPFRGELFLYGEDVALCTEVRRTRRVAVVASARARQRSGMTSRPGAHGYLIVRNALLLDAANGTADVVVGVVRSLLSIGAQLRSLLIGPAPMRRFHRLQAIGMWVGIVDGLRGVSGPPPERFRRLGDIGGTAPTAAPKSASSPTTPPPPTTRTDEHLPPGGVS